MSDQCVQLRVSLAVISGVMLGFSFPPFQTGVFAAFAFVPFLIVFESLDDYGSVVRCSYVWLFVFHAMTLYWTGGFTHAKDTYLMIAGAALLIAHPLFYFPVVLALFFFRKRFGFKPTLFLLPFLWVVMEYLLSVGELSFPWLTLGNTQTYDLPVIQIASVTGVYGISFWLLWLNVMGFFLYTKVRLKEWTPLSTRSLLFMAFMVAIFLLPKVFGSISLVHSTQLPQRPTVRVGLVQPNIDPFEKWQQNAGTQLQKLEQLTDSLSHVHADLVIWPETAIPFYILHPNNQFFFNSVRQKIDSLGVNLLTGIPDIKYYDVGEFIPKSSKVGQAGKRYDTFNSAMLLQPHAPGIQKYAKIILVPFAERVPYSEELSFLNAMKWNFGLGGWGIGRDTTIFLFSTPTLRDVKFSSVICYESVFPDFVASFVRKGAQFLTVITNDSWWGNTSGAYQHEQYAVLRAVENRRWVARCANGGISCFIDPFGHILHPTQMFTQTTIAADIEPAADLTFYSQHGDWLAEFCAVITSLLLAVAVSKRVYERIKKVKNELH